MPSSLKAAGFNPVSWLNSKLGVCIHTGTIPRALPALCSVLMLLWAAALSPRCVLPQVELHSPSARKRMARSGWHAQMQGCAAYRAICSPLGLGWWYKHKITIYKSHLNICSALIRKKMKHIKIITPAPSQRSLTFQLWMCWNHSSQPRQKLTTEV